jgi:uncharacterized protein
MNTAVIVRPVRTLGALTMLLMLPLLAAQAQDDMEKGKPARRLTVTGQGEVKAKPDKADITIGVVTENKSSQVAAKENAEASKRVHDTVKKLGIADKDIQTVNYSVQPLMVYPGQGEPRRKPEITGYRVYNQVRVTVRDLPKMGDILDAATQAGSNTIEGIALGLQDPTANEDMALEKAVREARRKADRMAMTAGTRILGVYEINEGTNVRPIPVMYGRAGAAAEDAATPIQPGELTVTATVTIVYEIERAIRNTKASETRRTAGVPSVK